MHRGTGTCFKIAYQCRGHFLNRNTLLHCLNRTKICDQVIISAHLKFKRFHIAILLQELVLFHWVNMLALLDKLKPHSDTQKSRRKSLSSQVCFLTATLDQHKLIYFALIHTRQRFRTRVDFDLSTRFNLLFYFWGIIGLEEVVIKIVKNH